jgi:hypothetical protein
MVQQREVLGVRVPVANQHIQRDRLQKPLQRIRSRDRLQEAGDPL